VAKCLLDTSVFSNYLDGKEPVTERVSAYLGEHDRLTISTLTWYEVERGLRKIQAERRRRALARLCRECEVLPVDMPVLDRAADVWVQLQRSGRHADEVDILLAATALVRGLAVATKDGDYANVDGLDVERWGELAE